MKHGPKELLLPPLEVGELGLDDPPDLPLPELDSGAYTPAQLELDEPPLWLPSTFCSPRWRSQRPPTVATPPDPLKPHLAEPLLHLPNHRSTSFTPVVCTPGSCTCLIGRSPIMPCWPI